MALGRYLDGKKIRESSTYGQVPKYLTARRKAREQDDKERNEKLQKENSEREAFPGYRQVREEERQALLKVSRLRSLGTEKETDRKI